jgi:hypothetical protein
MATATLEPVVPPSDEKTAEAYTHQDEIGAVERRTLG